MIYRVKDFAELEKVVNSELKLRKTKGSGAVHGDGDGKGITSSGDTYTQLLSECKYSKKKKGTISFRRVDWVKIKKAAMRFGRIPIMSTFTPDIDGDNEGNIFVLLELQDFKSIYLAKKSEQNGK